MENNAYTKRNLVQALSAKSNTSIAQAEQTVDFIFEEIETALKAERKIEFRGFGNFIPKLRPEKIGRNPKQPSMAITIPARKIVRFKVSKLLIDKLNA